MNPKSQQPLIQVKVLGSSSAGNSTLIWNKQDALLVDMGFSQRYMRERFEEAGVLFSTLKGVLITHLHSDHLRQSMLNKVLSEGIPVYVHQRLAPALFRRFKVKNRALVRTYKNDWFQAGPFRIRGFQVPHDSDGGCFGYNIHLGKTKVSVATDMGFPENGVAGFFKNSDVIVIESNHDPEMLANSGRSAELIERIHSIGHLSNEQCSRFLEEVFHRSERLPRAVALAHLSQDCNLPELARQTTAELLRRYELDTTQLQVSQKNVPSETLTIFDE